MAFIIYHCSSVEAFAPLKHYCFWVPTCCAQRVLWTVMYIVCDMGNKLWCERDLIVVAHFKRHLLFAISTRPRAACDITFGVFGQRSSILFNVTFLKMGIFNFLIWENRNFEKFKYFGFLSRKEQICRGREKIRNRR